MTNRNRKIGCLVWLIVSVAMPCLPASDEQWIDSAELGIFRVRSEFPLADIPQLAPMLQRLQTDVVEQLGIPLGDQPVEVLLFQRERNYKQYVSQRIPEGSSRRALFVQGPDVGWVYAYRSSSLDVDLRHEATHALLHATLPFVPLWLDEGLAEYFETAPGRRESQSPQRHGVTWSSRFGWRPNIEKLEAETEFQKFGRGDYRAAWSVVHFCLHGSAAARAELRAYLNDVAVGEPTEPFGVRLHRAVPDVEKQVSRYHR